MKGKARRVLRERRGAALKASAHPAPGPAQAGPPRGENGALEIGVPSRP
jgi:hypothetical protein